MIRAVLFDFNGVVVDDEPLHFQLFQKVLQEEGLGLERKVYYDQYLGMDDYGCLSQAAADQNYSFSQEKLQEVVDRKAEYYQAAMEQAPPFVPGALELIEQLEKTHFLAIVSGALRSEIESLLNRTQVRDCFSVMVAAGEVEKGKPDPEGYIKAMELLNRDFVASSERLLPSECLVFEDSIWGIQAAQGAGMPCVGVTTSYAEKDLPGALFYLKDFTQNPEKLLAKVEDLL